MQHPHDDLPEEALQILPLVRAFPYCYLKCDHFFLCSWQKKKGGNIGLANSVDIETIIAENSEITLYV